MPKLQPNDVIGQLGRITKHETFSRSPKMSTLLSYLITEELAGRGPKLKGYTVGVEALGKSVDFDPGSDASVRVETGRLRRMLATYYEQSKHDPLQIEIPKGTYRPVFTLRDRRKRESVIRAHTPSSGPPIAVLKFELINEDESMRAYSSSLREELLIELFQYKEVHYLDAGTITLDGAESPEQICLKQLDAEFMLRGQIVGAEDEMVISLSVKDLEANRIIWVERLHKSKSDQDLLSSAQEVAQNTVQQLVSPSGVLLVRAFQKRLGVEPKDWNTTDSILRWHYYRLMERTPSAHQDLRDQLELIVKSDPIFPLGRVMYALIILDEAVYRLNPTGSANDALRRAKFQVSSAITGDRHIALGHYVNAQCEYFSDNLSAFSVSAQRALELNPRNNDLQHHIGVFMCLSGNYEQGIKLVQKADMLFHNGAGYRLGHIFIEYFWGDPRCARELFETSIISSKLSIGQLLGTMVYIACDEPELAMERYRRATALEQHHESSTQALIDFWIKDPHLKQKVKTDFAQLPHQVNGLVK